MEILEIGEKLEGIDYDYRENSYGIIDYGDKFMLVFNEKGKNYSLPGGGIEIGETPLDALKREMIEEAGCKILSAEEIAQVHCFWNSHARLNHVERYSHIFKVFIDESSITEPIEQYHQRVFIDKKDAINLIPFPYQIAGIEYYLNKYKN